MIDKSPIINRNIQNISYFEMINCHLWHFYVVVRMSWDCAIPGSSYPPRLFLIWIVESNSYIWYIRILISDCRDKGSLYYYNLIVMFSSVFDCFSSVTCFVFSSTNDLPFDNLIFSSWTIETRRINGKEEQKNNAVVQIITSQVMSKLRQDLFVISCSQYLVVHIFL